MSIVSHPRHVHLRYLGQEPHPFEKRAGQRDDVLVLSHKEARRVLRHGAEMWEQFYPQRLLARPTGTEGHFDVMVVDQDDKMLEYLGELITGNLVLVAHQRQLAIDIPGF